MPKKSIIKSTDTSEVAKHLGLSQKPSKKAGGAKDKAKKADAALSASSQGTSRQTGAQKTQQKSGTSDRDERYWKRVQSLHNNMPAKIAPKAIKKLPKPDLKKLVKGSKESRATNASSNLTPTPDARESNHTMQAIRKARRTSNVNKPETKSAAT